MLCAGHGVFMWAIDERRSRRYGAIYLQPDTLDGTIVTKAWTEVERLKALVGRRVRMTAVVAASRVSGHVGDMFLGIKPKRPKVGARIDMGVGTLRLEELSFKEGATAIVLEPGDGRKRFWLDPRQLYRLHDQTVDLYIEETDEDFSPAPDIEPVRADGVLAVGGGWFQVAGPMPDRVHPKVEPLGGGVVRVTYEPGERVEAGKKDLN